MSVNQVNFKTLKASAKRFGFDLPKGTIEKACEAMQEFFQENFDEDSIAECPICKYEGPDFDDDGVEVTSCPFCGTSFGDTSEPEESEDEEEEETEEEEESEEEEETEDEEESEEEEETEDEEETEEEEEEEEKPVKKAAKGGKKAGKAAKTDKKSDKKPAKGGKKPAKGGKKAGKGDKKAAKAPKQEEEKHIVTDEQRAALDEAINTIQSLQVDRAIKTHDIGTWLVKIHDENLWKGLTTTVKTKEGPVERQYKNFFEFVKERLDISRSGSYKYMTCARNFTKEQFLGLGVKKAELIASAPERHRDTLIEAVTKDNASHVELKNRLAKLEGKTSAAPKQEAGTVLTYGSMIKQGDIQVPWISTESHQPVKRGTVKNKYAMLDLPGGYEIFISHDGNGMTLTVNIRKKTAE